MHLPSECTLLRIFIGENDHSDGRLLYEIIIEMAHRRGLAGATVLRGILGFGANRRIHTSRVLRLSQDLPVVVEIVDTKEKIVEFLISVGYRVNLLQATRLHRPPGCCANT